MEAEKISLDIRESTKLNRYFQLFFSVLCFIVAGWFFLKLLSTKTLTGSNGLAVIFLLLFGFWELLSGLGITQRYLIISEGDITLKCRYFSKPVIFKPDEINLVAFKPMSFVIVSKTGEKTVLKLGNYYQERTLKILESLKDFCIKNRISVEGLSETGE
jgi:hypothetical protein